LISPAAGKRKIAKAGAPQQEIDQRERGALLLAAAENIEKCCKNRMLLQREFPKACSSH
jgi:hypothetical protein